MQIEPLYDRIIVKVLEANERTSGGLWIPQMATDGTPWMKAEVREVGHGRITTSGAVVPLLVKKNDIVLFFRSMSAGEQLVVPGENGEEYLVIREANILGILRDLEKASTLLAPDGKAIVMQ